MSDKDEAPEETLEECANAFIDLLENPQGTDITLGEMLLGVKSWLASDETKQQAREKLQAIHEQDKERRDRWKAKTDEVAVKLYNLAREEKSQIDTSPILAWRKNQDEADLTARKLIAENELRKTPPDNVLAESWGSLGPNGQAVLGILDAAMEAGNARLSQREIARLAGWETGRVKKEEDHKKAGRELEKLKAKELAERFAQKGEDGWEITGPGRELVAWHNWERVGH